MPADPDEEKEANLFAMCLLMPEDFVKVEIKKIKDFDLCSDEHMKKLAQKFRVPQSLMAIRVGQLYGKETGL